MLKAIFAGKIVLTLLDRSRQKCVYACVYKCVLMCKYK